MKCTSSFLTSISMSDTTCARSCQSTHPKTAKPSNSRHHSHTWISTHNTPSESHNSPAPPRASTSTVPPTGPHSRQRTVVTRGQRQPQSACGLDDALRGSHTVIQAHEFVTITVMSRARSAGRCHWTRLRAEPGPVTSATLLLAVTSTLCQRHDYSVTQPCSLVVRSQPR